MLQELAKVVTTRRAAVIAVLLVSTVLLALQIPSIRVDPSIENLISSYEGEESGRDVEERFEAAFGDTEKVMVLLVEDQESVLRREPLQYLHALTRLAEEQPWVENVVSLTRTRLPRRLGADAPEGGSLDELEQELEGEGGGLDDLEAELGLGGGGGGLDDLEAELGLGGGGGGLDDLEAELGLGEEGGGQGELEAELGGDAGASSRAELDEELSAEVTDLLVSLIEADPARFPQGLSGFAGLDEQLRTEPIVEGDEVTDANVDELKAALEQSSLLDGRLVSEDRTVAVTLLLLAPQDSREMRENVVGLGDALGAIPAPEGTRMLLGGLPYLRSAIVDNIRSDQLTLVPLTLLVCIVFLALALRWVWGVVLPIAAVALTAVMTVGGMAAVGEPFNVLNNIIPTLLIIIGISDSVHLIGRYREELHRGEGKLEATRTTVVYMAMACLLTSVTTAVGLASLVVSRTVMLRHFGVTSAIGVMIAYVVTITFLPAVITWVKEPSARSQEAGGWLEAGIMRMTAAVLKRSWLVLGLTTVFLGVCIYGATLLEVDHALLDQFDEEDPVYTTTRLLEEKLDGVRPLEVFLEADEEGRFNDPELLATLDATSAWATERPEILGAMSHAQMLRQSLYLLSLDEAALEAPFVNRAQVEAIVNLLRVRAEEADPLGAWLSPDGRQMRYQIKVRDVGAQATMRFIADLEERLDEGLADTGVRFAFTGEAYTGSVGMDAVVGDLLGSLLTAIGIIFVLLSLLFRSLRLGLLSIPPNVIPLVATMAYMVVRDIPLNAATVIIFSISLGLAVDGSIHVLARFREETRVRGFHSHPALIRAARGTGRAIVISSVTLMGGFAVLLMSNFVPVRRFGELIAVTVASCLLATLVVQPALLQIAGLSRRHVRARNGAAGGTTPDGEAEGEGAEAKPEPARVTAE
ncbi:MAG: MMPL family transporter [Myxococcota bacterium]